MKNILAVTACLKRCSVAISYEGAIFEKNLDVDSSANLASVVDALIRENNIDLKKIDGVITASGPGSFTGIRVSQSFAKGIAFSFGIQAVSVDYFTVLAAHALMLSPSAERYAKSTRVNGSIVTLIESEKSQLYFRHYKNEIYDEGVASYENIKSYIRNNEVDVIIGNAGEELGEYREKMIYIDDFRNAKYLLSFSELLTTESKITPLYINARLT
ncbi:hypothetical protein FACS1894122_09440 [Alphaproteobacteria bacterium]|nr:hypothetical protein FACS1894122_09440 [Alphaproteobacteria bacterium]